MAYLIWVLCMLGFIQEDKMNDFTQQEIYEITVNNKAAIQDNDYSIGMAWDELETD